MGLVGLMSRATRTLACLAAGLSGVASTELPLHGASVAVAADENAYRFTAQAGATAMTEMAAMAAISDFLGITIFSFCRGMTRGSQTEEAVGYRSKRSGTQGGQRG